MSQYIERNKPGLDRAVRGVVKELNRIGYRTCGSCGGHYKTHRGFVSISPHRSELKKELAECPELLGWYQPVKSIYGDTATPIGFSKRIVDPDHIKRILKKHHIYPVYHEKPHLVIRNGKLLHRTPKTTTSFVHFFSFHPQMVGEDTR